MKYYVASGEMQEVVDAASPAEALRVAFERGNWKALGLTTSVSEQGFALHDNDQLYFTATLLRRFGLFNGLSIDLGGLKELFPNRQDAQQVKDMIENEDD